MSVSAGMREVLAAREAVIEAARQTRRRTGVGGNHPLWLAVDELERVEASHAHHVAHNRRETSKAAARNYLPEIGSVRWQVLDRIRSLGPLADFEMENLLGARHSTLSAARNHLTNIGYLCDSGYRITRTEDPKHTPHIRWGLTGKALNAFAANRQETTHHDQA